MDKYKLNIANAASTLVAELKSSRDAARTLMARLEAIAKGNGTPVAFNVEYDEAAAQHSCYWSLYDLSIRHLTKNAHKGPSGSDIDKFVKSMKQLEVIITDNSPHIDRRITIWNRTLELVMSSWLSYKVMVEDKSLTLDIVHSYLLPYGLAYEV